MELKNGNPVSTVSEPVESSVDSSMEDEDWTDEELETLTRAVAKLTYAMASWFDEERATEMKREMSRIEAMVASLIAEGKSAVAGSQEIDEPFAVDSSSIALTSDSPNLLKLDQLTESMEDGEENLPLPVLEESPKSLGDDPVDPALAKELIKSTAHQVFDELSAPTGSMEIEVSKGIKDNIPLQSLLPGNSSLDRVMLPIHGLGNGEVAANICDELLCFDPGGEGLLIASYGWLRLLLKSGGDGSILVEEHVSRVAHQLIDKMPELMGIGTELSTAFSKDIVLAESVASFDMEQATLNFDPRGVMKLVGNSLNSIEDGAQKEIDLGLLGALLTEPVVGFTLQLVFDPGIIDEGGATELNVALHLLRLMEKHSYGHIGAATSFIQEKQRHLVRAIPS